MIGLGTFRRTRIEAVALDTDSFLRGLEAFPTTRELLADMTDVITFFSTETVPRAPTR